MPQRQIFQIQDFSGGMNAQTDPMKIQDNQCVLIFNGTVGRSRGSIATRDGYKLQGSAIPTTTNVLGLGNLAKPDGTHKVIAVSGGDCYVYNPVDQDWDAQNQGLTSSTQKAEFRTFLNALYMVNYADDTRNFDGTDWSTDTNLSGAPKAKYLEVFENRLYLANVVVGVNSYTSRVYFSSVPSSGAITWDTTDVTGDFLEVETDDNDMVRGIAVNSGRLLIFKEYSMHLWDGFFRVRAQGAPGTSSQRSIVNVDDFTYYFNRDGVFRWDGATSIYISDPVKPYIDGLSNASIYSVFAGEKDKHYLLYIGDVNNTKEEIIEQRVLLDFDTLTERWVVHRLQTRPTVFLSCSTGAF